MGDVRFEDAYERVRMAENRAGELRRLNDVEVVAALAAASREHDPLLANVIATEAQNRARRSLSITDHLGDAVFVVDAKGRIAFSNPAAGLLLGEPPDLMVGRDLAQALRPRDAEGHPLAAPLIPEAVDAAGLRRDDVSLERADGRLVPVSVLATPMPPDGPARPEGVVLTVRDNTEPEASERALRASELRYRTLAEAQPELVTTIGVDGLVTYASPASRMLVGRAPEELLGGGWRALVHPADLARVEDEGRDAAAEGRESWRSFFRARHADGRWIWLDSVTRALKDSRTGQTSGAISVSRELLLRSGDVTAPSGTPKDRMMAFLLASAPVIVGATDANGMIAALAGGGLDALGVRPGDSVGRPLTELLAGRTDIADLVGRAVAGETLNATVEFRERWFTLALAPSGAPGGGVIAAAMDATELKRAQEEAARLRDSLERRVEERTRELVDANRDLEAFAQMASHDLKAPLRALDVLMEEFEEDVRPRLDAEALAPLIRARRSVARMRALVNDLLAFGRARQAEMELRDVDITALAREIVADLRERDPNRRVDVEVEPGLRARADPALTRVILENLLTNAWKYTGLRNPARIVVREVINESGARFVVEDNGIGFAPAEADGIFAPFRRLPEARAFEGTGLGLATVRTAVERHGGRAWAEGAPGRGAAFSFTLGKVSPPHGMRPHP